jgi:hypothetical protein
VGLFALNLLILGGPRTGCVSLIFSCAAYSRPQGSTSYVFWWPEIDVMRMLHILDQSGSVPCKAADQRRPVAVGACWSNGHGSEALGTAYGRKAVFVTYNCSARRKRKQGNSLWISSIM